MSVRLDGVDAGLHVTELTDIAGAHRTNLVLPTFILAENRLYRIT